MKAAYLLAAILAALASVVSAQERKPPSQPNSGPGGAKYVHASVRKTGPIGADGKAYYLYEPADPTPKSAPIVVFMHGYLAVNPGSYGAWIDHIVRRGHTVVFPVYQTGMFQVTEFNGNAMAAVRAAFERLKTKTGRVRPDAKQQWILVGHSLGCSISVDLAAGAEKAGLTKPLAALLATPGGGSFTFMKSAAKLPDMMLVVVAADQDLMVGDSMAKWIFSQAKGIQPKNRNLIHIQSDGVLRADHLGPCARDESYDSFPLFLDRFKILGEQFHKRMPLKPDAHRWYGYWKWGDGLMDAAFRGKNREYALGDTAKQRYMGKWSDGTPVKEAKVTKAE